MALRDVDGSVGCDLLRVPVDLEILFGAFYLISVGLSVDRSKFFFHAIDPKTLLIDLDSVAANRDDAFDESFETLVRQSERNDIASFGAAKFDDFIGRERESQIKSGFPDKD